MIYAKLCRTCGALYVDDRAWSMTQCSCGSTDIAEQAAPTDISTQEYIALVLRYAAENLEKAIIEGGGWE